jgi:hypothetical protein
MSYMIIIIDLLSARFIRYVSSASLLWGVLA